jgi:hypothetical protein
MLIEYPDEAERKNALGRLIDVEDKVWVRVGDQAKVYAIADEDLERETSEKTSSVHFLRFDLTVEMKNGLKNGQTLAMGIDHTNYQVTLEAVPEAIRQSLINDLQL